MSTRQSLYVVLDNVRSAYNVGSIFRTADGVGVAKIYICGFTPTPENPKVLKTSLGAERTVPWEYYRQTWRLLKKLKKERVRLVALEVAPKAKNIFKYKPKFPLALILGNEIRGISKTILKNSDDIIEIPMHGHKKSLNVSVSAGIALYQLKIK